MLKILNFLILITILFFIDLIQCDKLNDNNILLNNNKNLNNNINKLRNINQNDYYDEDAIDTDLNDNINYPINSVLDYPIGGFSAIGGGPLNLQEMRRREFAEEILFFIAKDGRIIYTANGTSYESMEQMDCNVQDNFTVIIHGWREQADTEWIPIMVTNFSKNRGGCIVIVDYGLYSLGPYLRLVQRYDQITTVIYNKMALWHRSGLQPSKVHMFGFSFGARVALAVGRKFGPNVIKSIDACDMAGPGFDIKLGSIDYKKSAENVQCIHTSRDKGTRHYTGCHQNWRIGYCGFNQPGASDPPYGSHGLCPYYYNLAFTYDFMARRKPDSCSARNPARAWPDNFKMGYMEKRIREVTGELFVPVSAEPPYATQKDPGEYNNAVMYGLIPNETAERIRRFRRRRPIMNQLRRIRENFLDNRIRFTQALIELDNYK